jgi:hypothetical protein
MFKETAAALDDVAAAAEELTEEAVLEEVAVALALVLEAEVVAAAV